MVGILQTQTQERISVCSPGDIEFSKNQELVLHLNRKYPKYNFYTMGGPVAQGVGNWETGKGTIEAATIDVKTTGKLSPLTGKNGIFFINYECDLLTDIVEPIIEELLAKVDEGSDIYLYKIMPVMRMDNTTPILNYQLRGHWPNCNK